MDIINGLNYINGDWFGADQQKFEVFNPATGDVVGTMPEGSREDVLFAIESANSALHGWKNLTAEERGNYLEKLFELMMDRKDEIARIITLESGKPLQEAYGEVEYAASFIKWFAEEGKRIYGRTIPAKTSDQRIKVIKQPVGVVAAITPWNFPAAMITRKLAPALAAGCTFIIKPSKDTPLTSIKLMELCEEAGIPKGVVNHVVCPGEYFSETIQKSTLVRKLTFTGSTDVGRLLMKQSADHIKNISLELGGQAPFIVLDDADIDKAVDAAIASKFRNAGQTCICSNRFYVQSGVYEKFGNKLSEEVKKLKVGNGMKKDVTIGPLINKSGYEKVHAHVVDATEKGAKIVVGGNGYNNNGAYFYEPTVILNAKKSMVCMNEETFGPIVPIQKFETDNEALKLANDNPYGLSSYFFTESITRGTKISEQLQFGIVGWNHGAPSAAQAPFGGMKESGLGREGGIEGIDEYLETKYISLGI